MNRLYVTILCAALSLGVVASAKAGGASGRGGGSGEVRYSRTASPASAFQADTYLSQSLLTYRRMANEVASSQFRALFVAGSAVGISGAKWIPIAGTVVRVGGPVLKGKRLADAYRDKSYLEVGSLVAKEIGIMAAVGAGTLLGGAAGGATAEYVAVATQAYLESIGKEVGGKIGELIYE